MRENEPCPALEAGAGLSQLPERKTARLALGKRQFAELADCELVPAPKRAKWSFQPVQLELVDSTPGREGGIVHVDLA